MLEISGYEVGSSIDHNRNMRLDVDHMSYEVTRGLLFLVLNSMFFWVE